MLPCLPPAEAAIEAAHFEALHFRRSGAKGGAGSHSAWPNKPKGSKCQYSTYLSPTVLIWRSL